MKKLVIALTAVAAFTGSAVAADLGARPYAKAPAPVVAAYNWTGFYIFGGGGGGLWSADSNVRPFPGGVALTRDQRHGGSGWFGTVGGGYDMQFGGRWVAGIFGDAQFGDIRGSVSDPFFHGTEGRMKLETSYAAGVRLGYLVAPNVLSYVNAGYSGSEWSGTTQAASMLAWWRRRSHHAFLRSQWMVYWRRRREQSGLFRHLGSRLVHEDRVSLCIL